MAKRPDRGPAKSEPVPEPTYQPDDDEGQPDPSMVVVDVNQARIARSDNAKAIAAAAKAEEQIEQVKNRRAGSGSVFEINPYDLYLEEGWNVRNFETPARKANIAELAASIGAIGVKEALLAHIKDNKIIVHSGWNRLLATYHAIENGAPVMAIPVRFGKASENDADRTLSQLVNNGVRSDLTPYEKGLAIKRMINFGWSEVQIAQSIGKSVTNVKGLLDLQALPMSLQELVASGVVSPYFATKAYREAEENEELALRELHSAIENAKAAGSSRVMPKHGEHAPPRRTRGSGGGGGSGGRGGRRRLTVVENNPSPEPEFDIPLLVSMLQQGSWERDEESGTGLASFPIEAFDAILQIANIEETGIEPIGEVHISGDEPEEFPTHIEDEDGNNIAAVDDDVIDNDSKGREASMEE